MSYRDMVRLFEQRRRQMLSIYKGEAQPIKLTKKHQMYGAMKEIDLFLEVLKHHAETEPAPKPKKQTGLERLRTFMEKKIIEN